MEKPNRFFAIHNTTKEIRYFNNIGLKPYQFSGEIYQWVIWEDTRYKAKLRLYNYVTFTKMGLEIPTYKPFAGTEIGKTTPILNF